MVKRRILWVSRHPPLLKQLQELQRIFGDYEIHQYAGFVRDVDHLVELMRLYQADEVVTILPLSIIYRLVAEKGIHPIWPEMEQVNDLGQYDYEDPKSGRKYRFKRFIRVKSFRIEGEPL